MSTNNPRVDFLQEAVQGGHTANDIDKALRGAGLEPLSYFERATIEDNTVGQSFRERAGANIQRFGSGLSSFGGLIGLYAKKPEFREQVNTAIGDYAKDILTGERNLLTDFVNLNLSPYQTSVEDIGRNPIEAGKKIIQSAWARPFDATLDATTFIPAGVGRLAVEGIAKVTEPIPVVNQIRRAIIPTSHEQQANRLLNLGETVYAPEVTQSQREVARLQREGNLEDAVRNLTVGDWDNDAYTKAVRDYAERFNRQMVDLGLDRNDAIKVARNQYILEQIDPNRTKGISIQAIDDAVNNPTQKNLNALGITPEQLADYAITGERLFDEGRIFPITQRGLNTNSGLDIDRSNKGLGLASQRLAGTATPREVAENFEQGYRQLQAEIINARTAVDGFNTITTQMGRKISPADVGKIKKGEVVVSPAEFNNGVRELFATGKQNEIGDLAKRLGKGANQNTISNYADDLYVISKADMNALTRRINRGANTVSLSDDLPIPSAARRLLGTTTDAIENVLNAWRGTVLARPQYLAGNRIGNLILNSIGGADYGRVVKGIVKGDLLRDLPAYLRTSTSYHGLNPSILDIPATDLIRQSSREIGRAARRLVSPESTLSERLGALGNLAHHSQELITRPLFQVESTLELFDRGAQYFQQARRLAGELGTSTDDIIRRARTDQNLQRELISRVNNVLGDYIGRNYYLDSTARNTLRAAIPFNRVITTAGQTMTHALRNYPLQVQALLRDPARIGYAMSVIDAVENRQPRDNDPRGGLTISPSYSRRFPRQVIYNDYAPILALTDIAQNLLGVASNRYEQTGLQGLMETFAGNLSPATGIINALKGRDRWGNPAAGPNTYTVNGQTVTLDNNGNPTRQKPDILGAGIGYIAQNLMPVATFFNNSILPSIAMMTGQPFYRPSNRTVFGQVGEGQSRLPYLYEGRTDKTPIDNYTDYLLNQLGWRTREVYYPQLNPEAMSPSLLRNYARRRAINQRMVEQRRRRD